MDITEPKSGPPPGTRSCLLAAAARVIRTQGMGKLTLESVALEAGVSKGGLLYHFASREALLSELLAKGFDDFDEAVSKRSGRGMDWLDAYIDASLAPGDMDDLGPGLLAAVTENPALLEPAREKYRQWYRQAGERAGIKGVLVLLMLDGLFMQQILGLPEMITPGELVGGIRTLLANASPGAKE